ncbi:amino acid transporter [Aspergillus varians]
MSATPTSRPEPAAATAYEDARLESMGYEAELPRHLSMLSIFGLSCAIIAVPFGASTTLSITLVNGESVSIIYGWILVTLISLCIAASLAEICAVFPTAGGVYYWSAILCNERYAPVASWITGWLLLVGNWMSTCSITFGGSQLILSAVSLYKPDWVASPIQTVLTFWAVVLVCFLFNAFGSKYLDIVNKLCVYWTAATSLIVLVVLFSMGHITRDAKYVFSHFDASRSGWPDGWSFCVGMLQATFTLTGYGMVAAMCEEVQNAEREVPRAMVLSVVASGITGLLWFIPILFVLPDITALLDLANGQPIGAIFMAATGSAGGGLGLLILIIGVMIFAAIAAMATSSRCVYSFARDGAIPGSHYFRRIDERFQVPMLGLALSAVIICLIGLIYLGSATAFNSFTGVTAICLSLCFGSPVLISLLRGRKLVKNSTYSLGKLGYPVNIISVCWICFALVLFCMPVSVPVEPTNMNYASVVIAAFAIVSVVWYMISGRKHFSGPPVRGNIDSSGAVVLEGREYEPEDPIKLAAMPPKSGEDAAGNKV